MNTEFKSKIFYNRTEALNWIKIQYANYPDNSILSSWTDTWLGETKAAIAAYIVVDTDIPGNHKIKI